MNESGTVFMMTDDATHVRMASENRKNAKKWQTSASSEIIEAIRIELSLRGVLIFSVSHGHDS